VKHTVAVIKTTRLWSLFFLFSLPFIGTLLFSGGNEGFLRAIPRNSAAFFGYGGVADGAVSPGSRDSAAGTLFADPPAPLAYDDAMFGSVYGSVVSARPRSGIEFYSVKEGDTVAGVAARYGLDAETIISANEGAAELKKGKRIPIPDVPGTIYRVQKGDVLEEIAGAFGISPETIISANAGYKKTLEKLGE